MDLLPTSLNKAEQTDRDWETVEMTDCNFIWLQKFITKEIAKRYWPDRSRQIDQLSSLGNQTNYSFYFLPENYNSVRNQFLTLSQIWYPTTRKKKFLYSKENGISYDFYDDQKFIKDAARILGNVEVIELEIPTWNVAVTLNNEVMFNGHNPLKFDKCPIVPIFWNYDPFLSQPNLRVRSLIRPMRDIQFLLNRRIILNHDISESSINTGFIRKENI